MKKHSPENLVEKWLASKDTDYRAFLERRPTLISYVRRLAKRLKGWKTAEELTVKDREGRRGVGSTARKLKELMETGLVQMAWDSQGWPHYAWADEKLSSDLYVDNFPWEEKA